MSVDSIIHYKCWRISFGKGRIKGVFHWCLIWEPDHLWVVKKNESMEIGQWDLHLHIRPAHAHSCFAEEPRRMIEQVSTGVVHHINYEHVPVLSDKVCKYINYCYCNVLSFETTTLWNCAVFIQINTTWHSCIFQHDLGVKIVFWGHCKCTHTVTYLWNLMTAGTVPVLRRRSTFMQRYSS